MNAGWPGSCGFLPRSPREPSCPILSGPLSPRSFSWGDRGIPEATQDPDQGSVPQGSKQRRVPLPAASRPSVLPFLLPLVCRIGQPGLGTQNLPEGRPEAGSGDRGSRLCESGGCGPGWAPPPCSHPQRALIQMLLRAAGSPHPASPRPPPPPGPRGAQEGSRLRGRSDSEEGTGRTGFVHD